MSVALLIITHDEIGSSLLQTAHELLGHSPVNTHSIAISGQANPEQLLQQAETACQGMDQGEGILILTDMIGSTPSNIASRLLTSSSRRLISGINLPMLIRIMNYPQLTLDELADKAMHGARDSIIVQHRK